MKHSKRSKKIGKFQQGGSFDWGLVMNRADTPRRPGPSLPKLSEKDAEKEVRDFLLKYETATTTNSMDNVGSTPLQLQRQSLDEKIKQVEFASLMKDPVRKAAYDKIYAERLAAIKADNERKVERELDRRKKLMAVADNIQKGGIADTREDWSKVAQAAPERMRFFPNSVGGSGEFFDEYVNPLMLIGNIARGFGEAPLRAEKSNSVLPYATALGFPLAYRAMGARPFEGANGAVQGAMLAPGFRGQVRNLWDNVIKESAKDIVRDEVMQRSKEALDEEIGQNSKDTTMYKKGGSYLSNKKWGGVSRDGYRSDSPDRYRAYNIIPSNQITMQGVPHPVLGTDNLGNQQMMFPGYEYIFPGSNVLERPYYVPKMESGGDPGKSGKKTETAAKKVSAKDVRLKDGYVKLGDYGVNLYNQDGTYSPEAIAFAEEIQAANPNTKVKFVCNEKGCFAVANRVSEGETGERLYGPGAWQNTGTSVWQAPALQNYQVGSGQPLPDPKDYSVPETIKGLPRGLYVGMNRKNNRVGGNASNTEDANDSYDYANNKLYDDSRGYEHIGYTLGNGRLLHGTGAAKDHPGYFVIDDLKDNEISLSGYGKYAPVEVLSTNSDAQALRPLYNGPTIKKEDKVKYKVRWNEDDSDKQRESKLQLVNYFNNPDLDKRMMAATGMSYEDLQGLKPVLMGVMGNESKFNDVSLGRKVKEFFGGMGSNPSVGPFQVKLSAVPEGVRNEFGISKKDDMDSMDKGYPAALAALYTSMLKTDQAVAEGKQPGLKDMNRYFRSAYHYNMPLLTEQGDQRLEELWKEESGGTGTEAEKQQFFAKMRLRGDIGSYAYKAMENAYDLDPVVEGEAPVTVKDKGVKPAGNPKLAMVRPGFRPGVLAAPSNNNLINPTLNIFQSGGPVDVSKARLVKEVPHSILGIDNMGASQVMHPGVDYRFPGQMVFEMPLRYKQVGGEIVAPEGYVPSTVEQRVNWNQFLDYLESKGVAGSKDLDERDKSLGLQYLKEYNKVNPKAMVPEGFIPTVQYESNLIRKQNVFPGLTPEEAKIAFGNMSPAFKTRPISNMDNWLGQYTSKQYYPGFSRVNTVNKANGTQQVDQFNFGVNFEDYVRSLKDSALQEKYRIFPEGTAAVRQFGGNVEPRRGFNPSALNNDTINLFLAAQDPNLNKFFQKKKIASKDNQNPFGVGAETSVPATTTTHVYSPNPGLAAGTIAGMSFLNNALEANDRNRYEDWIRLRGLSDSFGAVQPASRGDYTLNEKFFRPDQHVAVQYTAMPTGMAQMGGVAGNMFDEPITTVAPMPAPDNLGQYELMPRGNPYQNMPAGPSRESREDVPAANTKGVKLNDTARQAYSYYVNEKGLNPVVAAGAVGNLFWESGLQADAKERGGTKEGRGIAQWGVNERWKGFLNWAEKNNRDKNDLYAQLDYVWEEKGESEKLRKAMQDVETPEKASYVFGKVYERPLDKKDLPHTKNPARWDMRAGYARMLYDEFNSANEAPADMTANQGMMYGPGVMQYGGNVNSSAGNGNSYGMRSGIQPVNRNEANVEAERGETVMGDFDQDGMLEHLRVGGERHSNGGTPINVPSGAFIFSDTKKMKIGGSILEEFGKSGDSKKKYTPAELAKQYQLNKYKAILQDPNSDRLERSTAELMLSGNQLKLSKLALLQEALKGFPNGVPDIAAPLLSGAQGYPAAMPEGLMKAQTGGWVNGVGANVIDSPFLSAPPPPPPAPGRWVRPYGPNVIDSPFLSAPLPPAPVPAPGRWVNTARPTVIDSPFLSAPLPPAPAPVQPSPPGRWITPYEATVASVAPSTAAPVVVNNTAPAGTADPKRRSLYGNDTFVTANGQVMLPTYLQGSTKADVDWVQHKKSDGTYGNQQWDMEDFFARHPWLAELRPNFDPTNPEDVKWFQEEYDKMYQNVWNKKYFTGEGHRKIDGKFGQGTYSTPGILGVGYAPTPAPTNIPEEAKKDIAKENVKTRPGPKPDDFTGIPNKDIGMPWWAQDKIDMGASIINRYNLKKYMPTYVSPDVVVPTPTFMDTRLLAANQEQAAQQNMMSGLYSGAQRLRGVGSNIQGAAFTNAANALGQLEQQNVGIANQFAGVTAETINKNLLQKALGRKTYLDELATVNQQYDNSKMLGNENIRRALENAMTNSQKTYWLNKMNDQYNIDPRSGRLYFTKGKGVFDRNNSGAGTSDSQLYNYYYNDFIKNNTGIDKVEDKANEYAMKKIQGGNKNSYADQQMLMNYMGAMAGR